MNRVFVGLAPFLLLGGFLAYAAISARIVEQHNVETDRKALPFLKAANYDRPEGCPNAWNGKRTIPSECASHRYAIKSDTVARQFNLPHKLKHTDGWYRIGNDAFNLTCWFTCHVDRVQLDVFAH